MKFTTDYLTLNDDTIKQAKELIEKSDQVLIGGGAGLTAAGGVNYFDYELTKSWFPQYTKFGYKDIMQIQSAFWNITKENAQAYYAFYALHIWHVRFETPCLEPYSDLYKLFSKKEHFIITTNVDSQFEKAGFSKDIIFDMQGNYGFFQCSIPCSDDLYDDKEMIEKMLANVYDEYYIRKEDIPYCPHCGNFLVPNLRKDNTFVGRPHLKNLGKYEEFTSRNDKNMLLIELGVGFNTPSLIRYPFDEMSLEEKNRLIRINDQDATVPQDAKGSLGIKADIVPLLKGLLK